MPPKHQEVSASTAELDDVLWMHNDKVVYVKDIQRDPEFLILITSGGTFTVHPENQLRKVG